MRRSVPRRDPSISVGAHADIAEELGPAQAAYQAAACAERAAGARRVRAIATAIEKGLSLTEIGSQLGMTKARVAQLRDAGRRTRPRSLADAERDGDLRPRERIARRPPSPGLS